MCYVLNSTSRGSQCCGGSCDVFSTIPEWFWIIRGQNDYDLFGKAMMFCFDLIDKRWLMLRVYKKSTCGASAIETDRVVWNLSLECNFVQAASEKMFIKFIKVFENVRRHQWQWVKEETVALKNKCVYPKITDLIRTTCITARRKFSDNFIFERTGIPNIWMFMRWTTNKIEI